VFTGGENIDNESSDDEIELANPAIIPSELWLNIVARGIETLVSVERHICPIGAPKVENRVDPQLRQDPLLPLVQIRRGYEDRGGEASILAPDRYIGIRTEWAEDRLSRRYHN
jgi:hypothetical protein